MGLDFRCLTPENWREVCGLKLAKGQESYVLDSKGILAKALAYKNYNSQVYIIYLADSVIGIMMTRDYRDLIGELCILDQMIIDEKYQGHGYGRGALKYLIDILSESGAYDFIRICYTSENFVAENLYRSMGFAINTNIVDDEEIAMDYALNKI